MLLLLFNEFSVYQYLLIFYCIRLMLFYCVIKFVAEIVYTEMYCILYLVKLNKCIICIYIK